MFFYMFNRPSFEFQAAIFTIHISFKGDASFSGTTFPITTFLGTKFKVRIGNRVSVRVRIMVWGLDYGIVVTAIVLPGIAVSGIVRELCSRGLASKTIFISFLLKFWHYKSILYNKIHNEEIVISIRTPFWISSRCFQNTFLRYTPSKILIALL